MNPHCGMCFIVAGMYKNPTLTSDKITMQIDESVKRKKADRLMRMKVAVIAKVLSNKMVHTIDHVSMDPMVHL
jgi:hypothetical protein